MRIAALSHGMSAVMSAWQLEAPAALVRTSAVTPVTPVKPIGGDTTPLLNRHPLRSRYAGGATRAALYKLYQSAPATRPAHG
ncbi:hypothetical protein [Janthinobacterium agaricidamnosum]|uniref:Uncharacterized protein n=1 Tax=Janthinobacterium agaricidamnosum NBRC 102515 = DSM 9628 TaxID=1349767 RepID=W0V4U4_9BURK|nr:hypothetical protein [Janthinobacterium agaricidamnosum]CDG82292.1 hypothetical protein GJA_1654 [Janthinobacterium agaricidamnosum NBRC 102515 = DSM 9628]